MLNTNFSPFGCPRQPNCTLIWCLIQVKHNFLSSELTLLCLMPHGMLVFKKMLTDNGSQYFYSNYIVYFKSHELYEVCNFTISYSKSIKTWI